MVLEIVILSIVLVALAGSGLAVKYYNKNRSPSCTRINTKHEQAGENNGTCSTSGAGEDEICKMDKQ
jgi:hypothetical protein